MAINDKFEPFSAEAIKARDKIVECMIVMAKIAYGAHNARIPKSEIASSLTFAVPGVGVWEVR
jgi:hypothetical protein